MCSTWILESNDFYSSYNKKLLDDYPDVQSEELNPIEALKKIELGAFPDVVVLDTILPFIDGKKLMSIIKKANPQVEFIIMADMEEHRTDMRNTHILPKPFFVSEFRKIFTAVKKKIK